jgi:hypothetical protein
MLYTFRIPNNPSKDNLYEYVNKALELLNENNFKDSKIQISKTQIITFRSDLPQLKFDYHYILSANEVTQGRSDDQINSLKGKLAALKTSDCKFFSLPTLEIECLQTGISFPGISGLKKYNDDNSYEVSHNQGEKLLIVYYDFHTIVNVNHLMSDFGKVDNLKVVLIGSNEKVQLDKEYEGINCEQYFLPSKDYKIKPRVTLINEEGIIVKNEGLFSINSKDLIDTNPIQDALRIKEFKNFIKENFLSSARHHRKYSNVRQKYFYSIGIHFPKTIRFNTIGVKTIEYKNPIIRCEIEKPFDAECKQILENNCLTMKPDIEIYDKNTKSKQFKDIKIIQELIKIQNIPMTFDLNQIATLNITNLTNSYLKNVSFNPISSMYIKQVCEFTKKIMETQLQDQCLLGNIKMKCTYEKDETFRDFQTEDLYSDDIIDVSSVNGKITLILFWSSTCIFSRFHMEEINSILQKLPEMVCYAVCYDLKESCKNYLNAKDIKNITQCKLINPVRENEIITLFSAYTVPTIGVINKLGKIAYVGHPNDILLEKCLKDLDNDIPIASLSIANPEAVRVDLPKVKISKEAYKKIKENTFSDEFLHKLKEGWMLPYMPEMTITLDKATTYNSTEILKKEYYKPNLNIKIKKKDYEKVHTLLAGLIPNLYLFNINKELTESTIINFGEKCNICETQLGKFSPQYYCYFCKIWLCKGCGESFDDSKKGSEKFKHGCNCLVYINVKRDDDMDIENELLGQNILIEEDDNLEHEAMCNLCDEPVKGGPRFICLNCANTRDGFVDLCHHCAESIYAFEAEDSEHIRGKLGNHDIETHLLLRIYYCTGDYFEY